MIVADANVLLPLAVPAPASAMARAVWAADPAWALPRLWASEVRNGLLGYLRADRLSADEAVAAFALAARLVGHQHTPDGETVLRLGATHRISAYDLEYVVVAQQLGVPLVTFDKQVLAAFPGLAVHPSQFVAGAGA